MFFDLSKLSKQKFMLVKVIFELIYIILLVVGPTIVVCSKYKIFEKVSESATVTVKLTGVGIVLIIILGIYLYSKVSRSISKLPEIKLTHQRIKFTAQMIFGLIPIGLVLVGLVLAKDNINLAFDTATTCVVYILIAKIFDGLCLKYVDAESAIREEAARLNAIDARRDKV